MKLFITLLYSVAAITLLYKNGVIASPGLTSSITDKISDIGTLGAKAGKGIISKVPDLIPTPENLYSISKQTLIGLPFELVLSGIDKLCELAEFIFPCPLELPNI